VLRSGGFVRESLACVELSRRGTKKLAAINGCRSYAHHATGRWKTTFWYRKLLLGGSARSAAAFAQAAKLIRAKDRARPFSRGWDNLGQNMEPKRLKVSGRASEFCFVLFSAYTANLSTSRARRSGHERREIGRRAAAAVPVLGFESLCFLLHALFDLENGGGFVVVLNDGVKRQASPASS